MKKPETTPEIILSSDFFIDADGQRWMVRGVSMEAQTVQIEMVPPPNRVVSVAELRALYKREERLYETGERWKKESAELRKKLGVPPQKEAEEEEVKVISEEVRKKLEAAKLPRVPKPRAPGNPRK